MMVKEILHLYGILLYMKDKTSPYPGKYLIALKLKTKHLLFFSLLFFPFYTCKDNCLDLENDSTDYAVYSIQKHTEDSLNFTSLISQPSYHSLIAMLE